MLIELIAALQMAAAPADNAGWKAVKSDALILAEGGNLLLLRQPPDEADVQELAPVGALVGPDVAGVIAPGAVVVTLHKHTSLQEMRCSALRGRRSLTRAGS